MRLRQFGRGVLGRDFTREDSAEAAELAQRMQQFYASVPDYTAFHEASQQTAFWAPIRDEVAAICAVRRCRVLEFGAGRSGFGQFLGDELRSQVDFHVQDVTSQNEDYLREQADRVWIGPLDGVNETYDVVFSTFVYEHLASPRQALDHLLKLLAADGSLYLASPRYDLPGYVPPSARRLERLEQLGTAAWLAWRRTRVALGGRPDFMLHKAPACLDGPWFRDADAIHWVSRYDLKVLEPEYSIEHLAVPTFGWKQWVWARFALLFVKIRRSSAAAS
jgi:SAM-dependent methyltransferase